MRRFFRNFVKAYLTFLVKSVVNRFRPRFIVITGTAGKTTTKNMVYCVLREKFANQVSQTYGSMGTVIGLPLALLGFKPKWVDKNLVGPPAWQWPWWIILAALRALGYLLGIISYSKVWVVELTADKPGDFAQLVSYVRPTISIVTNVGAGHLEYFGDVVSVAQEKATIVYRLTKNDVAILNWHDELVRKMADDTKAKIYWVRAKGLDFGPAAARIVGRVFGMKYSEIELGLKNVLVSAHRFEIVKLDGGVTLVDSTYNANPVSVMAVLQKVRTLTKGRVIAVLGDMLELGSRSPALHAEIGAQARRYTDIIITIGELARRMKGDHHARNVDEALQMLRQITKRGDTIVVKASHGMRLDKLVNRLRSNQ